MCPTGLAQDDITLVGHPASSHKNTSRHQKDRRRRCWGRQEGEEESYRERCVLARGCWAGKQSYVVRGAYHNQVVVILVTVILDLYQQHCILQVTLKSLQNRYISHYPSILRCFFFFLSRSKQKPGQLGVLCQWQECHLSCYESMDHKNDLEVSF